MACSGVFGVPDTTRTCDPGLRRLVLYPTELLGHISKIFNFPPPTDSNELPLRRRTLYPAELPGQVRFFVLRRRYRIIVPQFAASVNAGRGF